jgi:hypothetical protein
MAGLVSAIDVLIFAAFGGGFETRPYMRLGADL